MNRLALYVAGLLCTMHVADLKGAVIINLNDFVPDPSTAVAIAPSGLSATLSEDSSLFTVLLWNDPGLGSPNVIIPGAGVSLLFDYNFSEPLGNDDEFGAFVIDANTGLSPGPGFEFFTDSSSTGTVSFDLTSLTGETLGLQFQLSALFSDTGFDSTLTVSNVRLEQSGAPAVPEPMSLAVWAVLCCTAAVGSRYRRFTRH